jgi:hypothetical protein
LQICCGSGETPIISEEIIANYPECKPENIEGKTWTAGYTAGL